MKNKIAVCLVLISLMIGAVGVTAAQSSSGYGIAESEDLSGTEITEMLDPSTFEEEMKSLDLPFTPKMPSEAEIERAVGAQAWKFRWLGQFDLPKGYYHWIKGRNFDGNWHLMALYNLIPSSSSHQVSGDLTDYGEHDDAYLGLWIGYPSKNYKYCYVASGQASCNTGKFNVTDQQVIMWIMMKHTAEDQEWDWQTRTHHYA